VSNALVRTVRQVLADQRIRFLIVGGLNTVIGYSLFALFQVTFGRYLGEFGYLVSLILSYAIAMGVAFVLHRKFVFQVQGNLWVDLGRFVLTNLVGFGLNAAILPLMVVTTGWDPLIAQALTAFLVAIASYLLHKHFSFRRKAQAHQ